MLPRCCSEFSRLSESSCRRLSTRCPGPNRYHRFCPWRARAMGLNKGMNIVICSQRICFPRLRFHATTAFDFFSAMYFFKARRFFCLLRLYEFFRASCFMLILLVRRDNPAGCVGWEFRDGLGVHAGCESCVAIGARLRAPLSDLANIDTFSSALLEAAYGKASLTFCTPLERAWRSKQAGGEQGDRLLFR